MATPPGRAGIDGPITTRIRAILVARLGTCRLGVTRLGYAPQDSQSASTLGAEGPFYQNWRGDPEPSVYGPAYSGTRVID